MRLKKKSSMESVESEANKSVMVVAMKVTKAPKTGGTREHSKGWRLQKGTKKVSDSGTRVEGYIKKCHWWLAPWRKVTKAQQRGTHSEHS